MLLRYENDSAVEHSREQMIRLPGSWCLPVSLLNAGRHGAKGEAAVGVSFELAPMAQVAVAAGGDEWSP